MSLLRKANQWTRWSKGAPLFSSDPTEEDEEWLENLENKCKDFHDPTGFIKRDIIHARVRGAKIPIGLKYHCPECFFEHGMKPTLGTHLIKEHGYSKEQAKHFIAIMEARQILKSYTGNVDFYYEIIEPREILPLPVSVEIDLKKLIEKGTKPPTPEQREQHDKEMKRWRSQMQNSNQPLAKLERNPNGTFVIPGESPNWWYWVPQIWREEIEQWTEATDTECQTWKDIKTAKRILFLIKIVPEE